MKKIILVDEDRARSKWYKKVFDLAGFRVVNYQNGESALRDVLQNGHDPLVVVGNVNTNDPYSLPEMKSQLDKHSRSTEVGYGLVAFNVPDDSFATAAMNRSNIPYITNCIELAKLTQKIDNEFKRILDGMFDPGTESIDKQLEASFFSRCEKDKSPKTKLNHGRAYVAQF